MPHPLVRALSKENYPNLTPTPARRQATTQCARSLLETKTRCKELAAKSAPDVVFVVRYAHTPSERAKNDPHSPSREQSSSPTETGPNTGSLDIAHAAALAAESAASSQQENPASCVIKKEKWLTQEGGCRKQRGAPQF